MAKSKPYSQDTVVSVSPKYFGVHFLGFYQKFKRF